LGSTDGLDDVEKRKFLTLQGIERDIVDYIYNKNIIRTFLERERAIGEDNKFGENKDNWCKYIANCFTEQVGLEKFSRLVIGRCLVRILFCTPVLMT
jgi:hypothetical protein